MPQQLKASGGIVRAFDLAGVTTRLHWDRFVIGDTAFGALRRAVRAIAAALQKSEDEELGEIAVGLQLVMAGWLTTPCPFDSVIPGQIRSLLGEVGDAQRRWGGFIAHHFTDALKASEAMTLRGNQLQTEVAEEVQRLLAEGRTIRIHCRRADRDQFETAVNSRGPAVLGACHFIHTLRDYREAPGFDVLLKVGPLRRRGIASTPDALISAPKFTGIVQFTWEGLRDDADFGADAFEPLLPDPVVSQPTGDDVYHACGYRWHVGTLVLQDDSGWALTPELAADEPQLSDDLDIRRQRPSREPFARASLVQLGGDQGILYPAQAHVMCLRSSASGFKPEWVACEDICQGMHLVLYDIDDAEGLIQIANHGAYAEMWKRVLRDSLHAHRDKTLRLLREAGIDLVSIASAVDLWAAPPTNVVPAPRREQHFMSLMKVVTGLDAEWKKHLWQPAWREVARSRGEAIVAGVVEHGKIRDRVMNAVDLLTPAIIEGLQAASEFNACAPAASGLRGIFSFRQIMGVESGFHAPDRELRHVRPSRSFSKWLC